MKRISDALAKVEDVTASQLMAAFPQMPEPVARKKAKDTRRGWFFVVGGGLMVVLAFGFIVGMTVLTKTAPPTWLFIFTLPFLGCGVWFILAGGNAIAGDAMKAAEESGAGMARIAARLVQIARAKE